LLKEMGLSGITGVQGGISFFCLARLSSGSTATAMFLTIRMVGLSRGIKVSLYW
jgi:hypothetical protein